METPGSSSVVVVCVQGLQVHTVSVNSFQACGVQFFSSIDLILLFTSLEAVCLNIGQQQLDWCWNLLST